MDGRWPSSSSRRADLEQCRHGETSRREIGRAEQAPPHLFHQYGLLDDGQAKSAERLRNCDRAPTELLADLVPDIGIEANFRFHRPADCRRRAGIGEESLRGCADHLLF